MSDEMIEQYTQTFKKAMGDFRPKTLLVVGSGIGALADSLKDKKVYPYVELGLPKITIASHKGELIFGRLSGKDVVVMNGRYHLYEGHDPALIKDLMCAFANIGIEEVILTNAVGSLNPTMPVGSLMLIFDHINFSGRNPLIGINDDKYKPTFPDLTNTYSKELAHKMKRIALEKNIELREGTYFMVLGPSFETRAETRAFRILGADVVGMSTIPEAIACTYAGMKVLAISVITNQSADLSLTQLSHEETIEVAQKATIQLIELVKAYMEA